MLNQAVPEQLTANYHLHLTGSLTPADIRELSAAPADLSEFEPLEDHLEFYDPAIWAAAKLVTSSATGPKCGPGRQRQIVLQV